MMAQWHNGTMAQRQGLKGFKCIKAFDSKNTAL
jgi:hypothetical protein